MVDEDRRAWPAVNALVDQQQQVVAYLNRCREAMLREGLEKIFPQHWTFWTL